MNRKMNLVLVLLAAFAATVMAETPKRDADGQYPIGSQVKVYDADFKPTDAYFTYFPGLPASWGVDSNAVILNFPFLQSLYFLKSNIGFVRNSIDKSIDWAATAKKNNVRSLIKEIPIDENDTHVMTVSYGSGQKTRPNDIRYLMFQFYIGDAAENGKDETWLIMNYLSQDEARNGSQSHFFVFHENDFVRLKEMFSESYLAEIDKQEAAYQKSRAEQDALFQ
jgi:hypothetical protein